MKKLPVIETTKYAYKFFFANFGKLFLMLLQYSGVQVLSYVTILSLVKDDIHYLIKNGINFSQEGIIVILAFFAFRIVDILAFLLLLSININMTRAIVNREEIKKNLFSSLLTSRTWKVLLTFILTTLLGVASICLIGLFIVGLSSAFSYFNLQGMAFNIWIIPLIIFGFITFIYFSMRLMFSIPNSALDHSKPIRLSWKMTRGSLLRLFGVSFLTSLPLIIWWLCSISFIFIFVSNMADISTLDWVLLSIPTAYLTMFWYAGAAQAYKHLSQFTQGE
ncbi:MAG: hypothetical protein BGO76_02050 [Caedibacter sp. 38-128]|nr:hypothetical protein [Holosporales bacterium]OJX08523.1 MAG: hypothetical protein BGO76_02050 [Caedibacter sp. 38-128]